MNNIFPAEIVYFMALIDLVAGIKMGVLGDFMTEGRQQSDPLVNVLAVNGRRKRIDEKSRADAILRQQARRAANFLPNLPFVQFLGVERQRGKNHQRSLGRGGMVKKIF